MSRGGGEIGGTDAEKLLPSIQRIPVLCREGAGGRHAFDVGQQQTSGCQRNDSLDVAHSESGPRQCGQSGRNLSRRRHPECRKPQYGGGNDRQRDDPERDRLPGKHPVAKDDQPECDDADDENDVVRLAKLPKQQPDPVEKIVTAAGNTEQTGQLGRGDGQAGAGLEADENAVADQLHERAQTQQPSEQAERRHRKGCEAGNLGVSLRVSFGHGRNGRGYHQGNRGCWPDGHLARGSEQGVAQTAEQIAVDADLRRQACKSRVGKRNRDRVGRQRYPGNDIAGQPSRPVFSQPAGWRKPPEPSCSFLVFHRSAMRLPKQSTSTSISSAPTGLA